MHVVSNNLLTPGFTCRKGPQKIQGIKNKYIQKLKYYPINVLFQVATHRQDGHTYNYQLGWLNGYSTRLMIKRSRVQIPTEAA